MEQDKNLDFLDQYRDEDGLVSMKLVQIGKDGNMSIENQRVETPFEIEGIVDILKNDSFLRSITKIYLEKKWDGTRSRSGAPIIGVPFSAGLQNAISGKRTGWSLFNTQSNLTEQGISGSLLANYNKRNYEIDFQLWEIILPLDDETYYIHGIYNLKKNCFSHFDGALIDIDQVTKEKMFRFPHIPDKKFNYQKLFKLDGEIPVENATQLMYSYLPIENLSFEYGISSTALSEVISS